MPATVLIVDDSKLARIVAARAITGLQPDWERVEASNAEEAIARMADHKIDLAILDYHMPGKNGLDLAADLRAMRPTMPIAIIAANMQPEVINRARAITAAFVPKPITGDVLEGFISDAALRIAGDETGDSDP
jgi:DNA-binding NarL/FixJ family response regulator